MAKYRLVVNQDIEAAINYETERNRAAREAREKHAANTARTAAILARTAAILAVKKRAEAASLKSRKARLKAESQKVASSWVTLRKEMRELAAAHAAAKAMNNLAERKQ